MKIDFKTENLIDKDAPIYDFFTKRNEHFQVGIKPVTYFQNAYLDMTSERTQLWIIEFNDRLQRCDGCRKSWNKPNTLDQWFNKLRDWVEQGNCDS